MSARVCADISADRADLELNGITAAVLTFSLNGTFASVWSSAWACACRAHAARNAIRIKVLKTTLIFPIRP
ncbi:MAG: hypothetical protein R3B51_06130 [Thermodesulfobacteriota bacterium]